MEKEETKQMPFKIQTETRTVQVKAPITRSEMYQKELAKTEEVLHRIKDKIKKKDVEAVTDAIEYLPRLQSLCAEYSRLLDGAGVEHRGYVDDSIIIDLCSRLLDVKSCLEDEKS